MKKALVLVAALLLSACAGTPFTFSDASRVKVGMTEDQVHEVMGNPYTVVSKGDSQMWIWSHATAFGGAKTVSFEFKDGRVASVPQIPKAFLSGSAKAEPTE